MAVTFRAASGDLSCSPSGTRSGRTYASAPRHIIRFLENSFGDNFGDSSPLTAARAHRDTTDRRPRAPCIPGGHEHRYLYWDRIPATQCAELPKVFYKKTSGSSAKVII